MDKLSVLNPVARSVKTHVKAAPRIPDLGGKRVGLYWNMKTGGDIALQRVHELLGARYPTAQFQYHQGDNGTSQRSVTKTGADKIAATADFIVGSTAD